MPLSYDQSNSGLVYDAPPATWRDRLQAGEAGILKGASYLAGLPADAVMNVENLGRAGIGAAYLGLGGKPSQMPSWLDPSSDPTLRPNPSGSAISELLDKSPVTTTQVDRPDDPASRWLQTAGAVVPGALAGGAGSVRGTLQALAGGEAGAGAAQGVREGHPFHNETAQAIAEQAAGLGAAYAGGSTIRGAPVRTPQNESVIAGQSAGYKFPAATTNPTPFTKGITRMGGGAEVQDALQAHNQPLANQAGRDYLDLGGQGPIRPDEIAGVRTTANADYQAMRGAGAVAKDQPLATALARARGRLTGAGSLSANLGASPARNVIEQLESNPHAIFDASDGVDAVGMLRDRSYEARTAGNHTDANAYGAAADAIEDKLYRQTASNPQTAGLAEAWQQSRTRLSRAHQVEDSLDANGNVQANAVGRMIANGERVSDEFQTLGNASNAAPKAFRVPEGTTAGGHGGFWGPITGALVGSEGASQVGRLVGGMLGHPDVGAAAGLAPILAYGGYRGAKALGRRAGMADALAVARLRGQPASGILGLQTAAPVLQQ